MPSTYAQIGVLAFAAVIASASSFAPAAVPLGESIRSKMGPISSSFAAARTSRRAWTVDVPPPMLACCFISWPVRQIDITYVDKKIRMRIYKIEKDTLTICKRITTKAKADAKRPEEFETTKRDDVVVLVFRKKK